MFALLIQLLSAPNPTLWPPVLPAAVCAKEAYCCPDAKRCLLPTKITCAKGESCADGQVCCPLTKVCVIPGAACTSPCNNATYCDGDLRHCTAPTNPGIFCSSSRDCERGESCSQISKLCVKAQEPCSPPTGKPVCKQFEYCCPDAKHCLKPSKASCSADDSCADGQVCCPITKVCVTADASCTSPCSDPSAYCNPMTKTCNKPTKPGVICKKPSDCGSGEECDPIVYTCVKPMEPCMPPVVAVGDLEAEQVEAK